MEEVLELRAVFAARRRWTVRVATVVIVVLAAVFAMAIPDGGSSGQNPQIAPPASSRAHIYAAALAEFAPARVTVDEPSIPADVRTMLRSLVGSSVVFGSGAIDRGTGPTIAFGALVLRGNRASLLVDVRCGLGCGHGDLLVLSQVSGRWTVTAKRKAWISF